MGSTLCDVGPVLWLVGQYRTDTPSYTAWDFQGVFGSKPEAVAACLRRTYFIAPVRLGEKYADQQSTFSGLEWPLIEPETVPLLETEGDSGVPQTGETPGPE